VCFRQAWVTTANSPCYGKGAKLSAGSGCLRLLCGSQGDESETDDSDNGEAEQIVAQIVVLDALHNHDAVMSKRGPASEKDEAAMLTRVAGGDQQEDAERDVNAEDHLIRPVDRRCRAVPERARERVKAGQAS
jgi:hypothetical protein